MKNVLKLEEAAMFGLCVLILANMGVPWWIFVILAIGPDISMVGYIVNNTIGAFCYNFFHHKGIAVAVFVIGVLLDSSSVSIIGIVLFGHSSMDRMLGYGLKLKEGFKYTHLGKIGNK
jgi:Domain of unknown function (DUF4260)